MKLGLPWNIHHYNGAEVSACKGHSDCKNDVNPYVVEPYIPSSIFRTEVTEYQQRNKCNACNYWNNHPLW